MRAGGGRSRKGAERLSERNYDGQVRMKVAFVMQDTRGVYGAEAATVRLIRGLRARGVDARAWLLEESRLEGEGPSPLAAVLGAVGPTREFAVAGNYRITPLPKVLSCGSLEGPGFPQFCDELSLCQCFDVGFPSAKAFLFFSESLLPIEVTLNGTLLGTRIWQNGNLLIPEGLLKERDNCLTVKLCGDVWNALERRWLGMPVKHVPFVLPSMKIVTGNKVF